MSDLALQQTQTGMFDIVLQGADLRKDSGLKTAVILSLHCDARNDGERGFWADATREDEHITGSLLWTLQREKTIPNVLAKAKNYAEQALQWLIDDGVASAISVTPNRGTGNQLQLKLIIERKNGQKWQAIWQAEHPFLQEI